MARDPHFVMFDDQSGNAVGMIVVREAAGSDVCCTLVFAPAGQPWHAYDFSSGDLDQFIKALEEYRPLRQVE